MTQGPGSHTDPRGCPRRRPLDRGHIPANTPSTEARRGSSGGVAARWGPASGCGPKEASHHSSGGRARRQGPTA